MSTIQDPATSTRFPEAPLLAASGIWKSYASPVLLGVDFELRAGELHALVGENGAGKTTLARIVAGLVRPDRGELRLGGRPHAPQTRKAAEQAGIRLVMQELNLVRNLTVAENIFLDHLPHRWGWIDYRALHSQAQALMHRLGLGHIDPARPIRELGIGQQQLVEIAAGLSQRCDVLILDEPTAALTDPEIELLFAQLRQLKQQGVGILYISHRLEEIQRIADRITVLRDGQMVATRATGAVTLDEIVRLMVGRELGEAAPRGHRPRGRVALRVTGLRRLPAVRDASFEVHCGEILGFAGLMGSGRTETMRAVFGADRRDAGEVFLNDSPTPTRIDSPSDAVRQGLALVTEDRKSQGLLLPQSIRANVTLTRLGSLATMGGWVRSALERAEGARWVRDLGVRCASAEQRVVELSGGNQQKVVIAKWLFRDSDTLIFDEPTRGIDVGAKFEIYRLLSELAGRGKAIVMVSSDLKELLAVCDRIAVMSAGRLVATFGRGEWSEDKIMAAAFSGYLESGAATNGMAPSCSRQHE